MKERENILSDTKKRIIEVAGRVFAESGFRNATVREICRLASVNIAAINYHFGDKKSLYLAAIKHLRTVAFEQYPLDVGSDSASPPEERLKAFIMQFIRRIHECREGESPWLRMMIIRELMEPTEGLDVIVGEIVRPTFGALSAIIREILGKQVSEKTIRLCCGSVIGQTFFFFYAQPIREKLFPADKSTKSETKVIADHITSFSLNAIKAHAVSKKRR
jgi:AcrR family transcriptional regulator